jgi:hypothetical protein
MRIVVTSHRMMAGALNDALSTQKGSTLDAHLGGRPNPFGHRRSRRRDGAFMEPSGRNRWQPVANGTPQKPLKQADPQPVATHGNGFGAHGKEGVDGSSPSEGFTKGLLIALFLGVTFPADTAAADAATASKESLFDPGRIAG